MVFQFQIAYLVFLGLFSYFLLTNFYPEVPSAFEYVVWGWTITMFIEEMRQVNNRHLGGLVVGKRNFTPPTYHSVCMLLTLTSIFLDEY